MIPILIFRLGIEQNKFKSGLSFLKEKEKFCALDINFNYFIFNLNGEFIYFLNKNKKKGIFFTSSFVPFWELEMNFGYKYNGENNILNLEISKDWIKLVNLRMALNYLMNKNWQIIFQLNLKI
uniref:Uncharacterized protein n=1 Tax=candidate division WOR-3 bacterium TaxID=2052148 RepID=A0A7V3ZVH5_UNCW3